jgi:hypothetical protein
MLITLDLPIELEKKLQTQAEMNQIPLNQLIEKLLHFQLIGQQMMGQSKQNTSMKTAVNFKNKGNLAKYKGILANQVDLSFEQIEQTLDTILEIRLQKLSKKLGEA